MVGVSVTVGSGVGVSVALADGARLTIGVGVTVGAGAIVDMGVAVGIGEGVGVGVAVGTAVDIGESVALAVGVSACAGFPVGSDVGTGVGSNSGVLAPRRTPGTGEAVWPASVSCPQANPDTATASHAASPIVSAMIPDCFSIYSPLGEAAVKRMITCQRIWVSQPLETQRPGALRTARRTPQWSC